MSLRSESRETESVGERSSSGANSVTSDDSSERTTSKKSEVPRNTLKYSYEFLLKLQKSKLSKKPPDCLDRLRQECILRETWRSDRDKDSERDTEFPAALTKPPPSFRGGCKVDKAVLSDIPNPGSNSVKKSAASKGERRVGSGRLGSYNKDRESDYGYPQERSRRLFDHQGSSDPPKRSNGRYIESNSSRGGCGNNDDEPEWFTKGPTSQTDTIELGGFEDKSRKGRTPSPSVRKPTIVNNQPLEGVDLLKELYDMSGSTHRKPAIDFEQFFGSNGGGNSHSNKHSHKDETERDDMSNNNISNNHIDDDDVQQRHIDDEAVSVPHGGSRFMSKVFAKTFDDESLPSSKPASPPTYAKDLESSPRPVLEMLENSKESSSPSVSSLLRDMFPRSGGENRSAVIMGQCAAPKFDSLEDLLSRGSHQQQQQQQQQQQNGGLMSVHPQMPTNTEMQSSMLSSNLLDVEKGVQGKNILELLLSGANVVNAPSTPHFAKSVEELEADLKMESSRMSSNNQAMFAPGATHQPHLDSGSMLPPVMGNGAIERSLGLMGDTQQSRDQSGPFGARHPFMNSMPLPQQQQQQQQQRPQQQAYQQTQPPQQQQQQANSTHNNASLDIMRLLMEGSSMPDRAQGKPYKQDVRNVPTSVLLQDKHRKSGQAAQPAGGPRPIVKSNKPPCPPQAAPSSVETGEDLLQRLFQQQQQEQQQQFAHQQYQQKQHPQQVYHSLHNQQQRYNSNNSGTSSSSNNRSYYGGGSFNGQSAQPQQQQQMRIGSSSRRPLTGGHSQRFPPSGLPPYGSSLMNNHAGNMMNSEASILSPDDALAKWFGNLSCNQPSLPVPTNVLRVEELERQSNGHRLRQAKPTAT